MNTRMLIKKFKIKINTQFMIYIAKTRNYNNNNSSPLVVVHKVFITHVQK